MKSKVKQVVALINEMIEKYGHTLSISLNDVDVYSHESSNIEKYKFRAKRAISSIRKTVHVVEEEFEDEGIKKNHDVQRYEEQYVVNLVSEGEVPHGIIYADTSFRDLSFTNEDNILKITEVPKHASRVSMTHIMFS